MLLGFDIGGTKCAVITAKWEAGKIRILKKEKIATDLTVTPEEMIRRLIVLADEMVEEKPESIGISCGGPLDSEKGIVLGPPNLPGWDHVEIVKQIGDHFGVKTYERIWSNEDDTPNMFKYAGITSGRNGVDQMARALGIVPKNDENPGWQQLVDEAFADTYYGKTVEEIEAVEEYQAILAAFAD